MNVVERLSTCLGILWLFVPISEGGQADGRALFLSSNCQLCHSVDAQGITKSDGLKFEGGDLSTIGDKRKKPEWLIAYLEGKEKGKNGLKHHQIPFVSSSGERLVVEGLPQARLSASDDELRVLAHWLTTLRRPQE